MTLLVAALFALTCLTVPATSVRQMILGVTPFTEEQMAILLSAIFKTEVEFTPPPEINTQIQALIPTDNSQALREEWEKAGMDVTTIVSDLRELAQVEEQHRRRRDAENVNPDTTLNHNYYRSYDQIIEDIKKLVQKFGPTLIRFDESGKNPARTLTAEGRIIHIVELGTQTEKQKPVILLEVNIHAREWITNAANLFMMDWILTNYRLSGGAAKMLLDNYTMVVVPVANPDGYEFSRTHPDNRMWRKNRHVFEFCTGVDLNRNFDMMWRGDLEGYLWFSRSDLNISPDEERQCPLLYPGPSANSEPETQALISIFHHYQENVVLHFFVHAYSEVVLMPWSYNSIAANKIHQEMGDIVARAMDYGEAKTVAEFARYNASGTSLDWALNEKLTESPDSKFIALGMELRPTQRDESGYLRGFTGFVLPPSEIIPTGREYMAGILAAASNYKNVTDEAELR